MFSKNKAVFVSCAAGSYLLSGASGALIRLGDNMYYRSSHGVSSSLPAPQSCLRHSMNRRHCPCWTALYGFWGSAPHGGFWHCCQQRCIRPHRAADARVRTRECGFLVCTHDRNKNTELNNLVLFIFIFQISETGSPGRVPHVDAFRLPDRPWCRGYRCSCRWRPETGSRTRECRLHNRRAAGRKYIW